MKNHSVITFKDVHRVAKKKSHTATVQVEGVVMRWECDGKGTDTFTPLKGMDGAFEDWKRGMERLGVHYPDLIRQAFKSEMTRRELRKRMDGHAVFVRGGKIGEIELHDADSLAEVRTYLKKRYPKAVLLNGMEEETALALYVKHVKHGK